MKKQLPNNISVKLKVIRTENNDAVEANKSSKSIDNPSREDISIYVKDLIDDIYLINDIPAVVRTTIDSTVDKILDEQIDMLAVKHITSTKNTTEYGLADGKGLVIKIAIKGKD